MRTFGDSYYFKITQKSKSKSTQSLQNKRNGKYIYFLNYLGVRYLAFVLTT